LAFIRVLSTRARVVMLVRDMKRLSGNDMTAVDSRRRSDREVRLANDAGREPPADGVYQSINDYGVSK
jgi:hypothetical protein